MASTWAAAFEAAPADDDDASLGDNEIRTTRTAIEERAKNEHLTYSGGDTAGEQALDWTHRKGSAIGYFQDAAPTKRPNAVTNLSATDNGRLWFDDNDDDLPYVYVHASWVGLNRELVRISIQGTLATGTTVLPAIIFPRGAVIIKASARVLTAPTGAALQVDFHKHQTDRTDDGSIFGTANYVEIADAAYYGTKTDMDGTINVLAADEYLTVDIDQVGSTVVGADLSITLEARVGA